MSEHSEGHISIWFFNGVLLTIYGVLIFAAGLYGLKEPPKVVLAELHAGVWWGAFLLIIGIFYTYHFWPKKFA